MLNGNMYAYTYWIEIEVFACHCMVIEWYIVVYEQGHCMACCRLVVDMSCHH